jgi:hypothetical protein
MEYRRTEPLGPWIVTFTLLTEGALLFVAAQTGFVGGPQVLATMAVDRWVPRRFASLSERMVTQDGVLAMGIAAAVILFQTRAEVSFLVVLYAINVFVTFTLLSQLGMSRLWWNARHGAEMGSQASGERNRMHFHGDDPLANRDTEIQPGRLDNGSDDR